MQDGLVNGWLHKAKQIQSLVDASGLGKPGPGDTGPAAVGAHLEKFDELVTDPAIRSASRELFEDEHYARSVEEAFKCLNNTVKKEAGLHSFDGASLMRKTFSANNPVLALNPLSTQSDQDEQLGYMDIYAGAMTGVRNPRAHEHELEDEPAVAIELLTLANHLMRKLDAGKRTGQRANT